MRQKCQLITSLGDTFTGDLIGAPLNASGELVFTTGMVGYSEAITDPSYFGQILCFSYPLIGNYGIPKQPEGLDLPDGFESISPKVAAVIITIDSPESFHWNSFQSLDNWLKSQGVPGIVGLDTRHLVHLIRSNKDLGAKLIPASPEGDRYAELGDARLTEPEFFDPGDINILPFVSQDKPQTFGDGDKTIALLDCGVKWNIVRQLTEQGLKVTVYPWSTDLREVKADGFLISNGPGDPTQTGDVIPHLRAFLETNTKPVLGICLGHQLISLALGAKTSRMVYGHRSHNQPVYQVGTRLGAITTQNHGYVVDDEQLPDHLSVWFRNANDQTIEGIRHNTLPVETVQFHPEASGGPRDTSWIITQFTQKVKDHAHQS